MDCLRANIVFSSNSLDEEYLPVAAACLTCTLASTEGGQVPREYYIGLLIGVEYTQQWSSWFVAVIVCKCRSHDFKLARSLELEIFNKFVLPHFLIKLKEKLSAFSFLVKCRLHVVYYKFIYPSCFPKFENWSKSGRKQHTNPLFCRLKFPVKPRQSKVI